MVCGGIRHDWCLFVRGYLYVSARWRLYRTIHLSTFGLWICAWLCGDCVGVVAAILPLEPHFDLHLFKYAFRPEVGEDWSGVFHSFSIVGLGIEATSRPQLMPTCAYRPSMKPEKRPALQYVLPLPYPQSNISFPWWTLFL